MRSKLATIGPGRLAFPVSQENSAQAPCLGRLALSSRSRVLVAVNGHPPVAARILTGVGGPALVSAAREGREALVVFDQGDATKPIIVGLVDATADEAGNGPKRREVVIDGEHLVIEGRRSVTLKCGKGSIEIREDGKIFVRGTHLVSRATGVNRIRGGAVRIN